MVAKWHGSCRPNIHILHHLGGERGCLLEIPQGASELLLFHCPDLGHGPFPEPIIIVLKCGLSPSVTTFGGEHRINSIQNNGVENGGVVISQRRSPAVFGREVDIKQPVYSKRLLESSIIYLLSIYCMLAIVLSILHVPTHLVLKKTL